MSLEGKKILFIAPKFFGYENEIKKEMEKLGAKVDYYDERPQNNNFTKAILRLKLKKIIQEKISSHYNRIFNEVKSIKFDYILFIAPESISLEHFLSLREMQRDAKFILYMWDSIENKNSRNLINYFDKAYTFDKNDIKKFPKMIFKPLFYIKDYSELEESKDLYDVTFIGTAHTDRYNLVKKIKKELFKLGNFKCFNHFYIQGKTFFLLRKLFDKNFRKVKMKEVSFSSLSKDKVLEIIKDSKVIIDIQHPKQVGLTMRTIEMLGARKKIITTNNNVKNYNFYNSSNILIVDRYNPRISKEFLETPYKEVDRRIYESYSLKNWILNIFEAQE